MIKTLLTSSRILQGYHFWSFFFFGISLFVSLTWQWVILEPLVELVDGFGDVVEGWVLGGGAVVVHLGHDVQVAELHRLTAGHRGDQPQPDQTKRTHQIIFRGPRIQHDAAPKYNLLIPKLAMLILNVHYEPLNSNYSN